MKKIFIILIALILGGAITVLVWEKTHPAQDSAITLYGNVDLRQVDLAFIQSERIENVLVEEGDVVKKGQKVAEQEKIRLQQSVDQAKELAEAARQRYLRAVNGPRKEDIAKAKANVQAATASLENAQLKNKRFASLALTQSVSRQDADDALAAERVCAANLDVVQKELDLLLAGTRVEDIADAEAEYRSSAALLNIRKQSLHDSDLYAPCDAVVRNRLLNAGDIATPQRPVLNLSILDVKWVRAYLNETQLGLVKTGDKANVYIDSFPGIPFPGTVGFISSVAEFTPKNVETPDLRTSLVYEIRIIVPDPDNRLRLGSPATVKLQEDTAGQPASTPTLKENASSAPSPSPAHPQPPAHP